MMVTMRSAVLMRRPGEMTFIWDLLRLRRAGHVQGIAGRLAWPKQNGRKGKGQNGAESSKSTGNEGEDPEGRVGHARILHFTLSEMGNLWRVLNTCDLKGFLLFVINNSEYFIFPLLIFGVIHNFIPYPFHK